MAEWISVKDRLPEKSGEYLVYGPYVHTAWFAKSLRENPQLEYYGAPDLPGFYNGDSEDDWLNAALRTGCHSQNHQRRRNHAN